MFAVNVDCGLKFMYFIMWTRFTDQIQWYDRVQTCTKLEGNYTVKDAESN